MRRQRCTAAARPWLTVVRTAASHLAGYTSFGPATVLNLSSVVPVPERIHRHGVTSLLLNVMVLLLNRQWSCRSTRSRSNLGCH